MHFRKSCSCKSVPRLVFSCSGAADVGEMADRAARHLAKSGMAKMFCLAGIGGRVSGILASARAAAKILVIDGCNVDCARKTLEKAGFNDFAFLRITDLGMEKGSCSVTEENITAVARECRELLS